MSTNEEEQFEVMDTSPKPKKSFNLFGKVREKGQEYSTRINNRMDEHEQKVADKKQQRMIARQVRKDKAKAFGKKVLIGIVLVLLSIGIGFASFKYFDYKRGIPVGYASETLVGQNYKEVEKNIKSSGFENVNVILLYDLELDAKDKDNTVDLVKINDTQTFTTTSHFPYDSPVEIVVHTVKTIPVSLSYKEAMGMDHKELVKSLKKAGFVNIKEEAIKDIVTGWITKDGQIESVTIDEKDDFGKEDKFRPDAPILIQYHTWKN